MDPVDVTPQSADAEREPAIFPVFSCKLQETLNPFEVVVPGRLNQAIDALLVLLTQDRVRRRVALVSGLGLRL